jgi:hypothetical protein
MPDDDGAPYRVWQFFPDDWHECVGEDLDARRAVELAKRMTETVGGRIGTTRRVIIEDRDGYTSFEWIYGKGVTYPTPEMCAQTSANIAQLDGEPTEELPPA